MKLKLIPCKLKGNITVPPSKSLAHRAIIAAFMAKGKSKISNLSFSKDIKATTNAMINLGGKITLFKNYLVVEGTGKITLVNSTINCGESGSTMRFIIPISLLSKKKVTFRGDGRLVNRPLSVYHKIFDTQKINYTYNKAELPLTIEGEIKPGIFSVRGDISSQFITGLLYTLPKLNGDSTVIITTKLESKGYIDLTLDILSKYGISIINKNYEEFIIFGNQKYQPYDYRVEGDFSQGAFWLVAGFIGEGVNCLGLSKESLQGDKEIINILKKMGAKIEIKNKLIKVISGKSHGIVVDLSQTPDLGPIIAVLGAVSSGTTEIINAKRLRIKESDRITAMVTELNKIGANIKETSDGMIITGVKKLKGGLEVHVWNDHRVAMALAIAGTICEKPIILDGESIKKSYQNFWDDFKQLGGKLVKI